MDWGSILNNALSILAALAGITGITGVTIFTALRRNRKRTVPQSAIIAAPHDQVDSSASLHTSLTWREWSEVLGVALINTFITEDALREGFPMFMLLVYPFVGILITGLIYGILFLFDMNTIMNDKVFLKVWMVSSFAVALIRFINVAVEYRDELLRKKQEKMQLH